MTDKQFKAIIKRIKNPKKLAKKLEELNSNLPIDNYYRDLWSCVIEHTIKILKEHRL